MAKCIKCGKKGIFFKINANGRCVQCERIAILNEEEMQTKKRIEIQQNEYLTMKKSFEEIKLNRDTLYRKYLIKLKKMRLYKLQIKLIIKIMN